MLLIVNDHEKWPTWLRLRQINKINGSKAVRLATKSRENRSNQFVEDLCRGCLIVRFIRRDCSLLKSSSIFKNN